MKLIYTLLVIALLPTMGFSLNPKDPSNSSLPGGYIGFGIQYGFSVGKITKITTWSIQLTVAMAIPSVGEPGMGPHLMPGITLGVRATLPSGKISNYLDFQVTMISQVILISNYWGGVGIGRVFSDEGSYNRYKVYGGFLVAGVTFDRPLKPVSQDQPSILGVHIGLAFPRRGYHFHNR